MNGLADMALQHLLVCMFAGEGIIDSRIASRYMEGFPEDLKGLTPDERAALSASAQRALARMNCPPDEHGYKAPINHDETAFLEVLASGELYEQWCQ
jgi:hypothetical protein